MSAHKRSTSADKPNFTVPYSRGRAGSFGKRATTAVAIPPTVAPLQEHNGFVNSPSPLKRSDALMNLDQTSMGSPSQMRSRRFGQVRKQQSVDNFLPPGHRDSPFGTPAAALSNPSAHILPAAKLRFEHKPRAPHPFSRGSITQSSSEGEVSLGNALDQTAGITGDLSLSSIRLGLDNSRIDYNTPSLKLVKPLQTAFMSTGLLSKQNRPAEHLRIKPTPDTPCKRPVNGPLPTTPGTPSHNSGGKEYFAASPWTPAPTQESAGSTSMLHGDSSSFDEYHLYVDNEGESSIIYASSATDLDHLPLTPTKGLFGLGGRQVLYPGSAQPTPAVDKRKRSLFGGSPIPQDKPQSMLPSTESCIPDASRLSLRTSTPSHSRITHFPLISPPPAETTVMSPITIIPACLERRFNHVKRIGGGAFSEVYSVEERKSHRKFAIKRSKTQHGTAQGRLRRLEEVEILQKIGPHEHILELFTSWEEESHLYMQTDFCENGSLDVFLQDVGQQSRLDEFRVWKVLTEMCLGVSYIHDAGFLHLDLKPANILVTFEGVLKIGDFGMSCAWPAPAHTEREGDREYIAPEVLSSGIYDKPVDIFSLGLMIFEVAANIVLPDNGTSWQKLRSGDLSDAPRLSSSDEGALMIQGEHVAPHRYLGQGGLDRVVKWMLSPDPSERPTAVEVLNVEEVVWANRVRKAGAIIFEGDRGPDAQEGDYDIYAGNGCVAIQEDDNDWRMEM